MTKLDLTQIKHIARLSRLKLTPSEEEEYAKQLSSILNYVELLSEVNTENVLPLSNVTGLSNVVRKDEIKEKSVSHNDIEINAPEFENGSFVVPGVFE